MKNADAPAVKRGAGQLADGSSRSQPEYIFEMAETFRCPHCRALYEIRYDKGVTDDNRLAHCQVCGKQMDARNGSSIRHYELVKMPDGTNV